MDWAVNQYNRVSGARIIEFLGRVGRLALTPIRKNETSKKPNFIGVPADIEKSLSNSEKKN